MSLRTKPQSNKTTGLPVGVSKTWRMRPAPRLPYLEYQVLFQDKHGVSKIKHFYVSVRPTPRVDALVRKQAVEFRKQYEVRYACNLH